MGTLPAETQMDAGGKRSVNSNSFGEIEFHPTSFCDGNGRVFWSEGELYRGIPPKCAEFTRRMFSSGVVDDLIAKKFIPRTELTDASLPGYPLVLHHERIPFVTYAYEWSPSMLRDAALFTLRLLRELAPARPHVGRSGLLEYSVLPDAGPASSILATLSKRRKIRRHSGGIASPSASSLIIFVRSNSSPAARAISRGCCLLIMSTNRFKRNLRPPLAKPPLLIDFHDRLAKFGVAGRTGFFVASGPSTLFAQRALGKFRELFHEETGGIREAAFNIQFFAETSAVKNCGRQPCDSRTASARRRTTISP